MIQIGKYTPAQNGREALIQREFYGQGYIVKDEVAYVAHPDQVCYVPELSDSAYTHNDFLALCNGQEELARECFYAVDWQSPDTWVDEQYQQGEWAECPTCGRVFEPFDTPEYPFCKGDQAK